MAITFIGKILAHVSRQHAQRKHNGTQQSVLITEFTGAVFFSKGGTAPVKVHKSQWVVNGRYRTRTLKFIWLEKSKKFYEGLFTEEEDQFKGYEFLISVSQIQRVEFYNNGGWKFCDQNAPDVFFLYFHV